MLLRRFLFTQAFTDLWSDLPPAPLKLGPLWRFIKSIITTIIIIKSVLGEGCEGSDQETASSKEVFDSWIKHRPNFSEIDYESITVGSSEESIIIV